jgi:aryl-alcohol dehydrogenase-like predicted oxidoreductase
MRYRVLGRTGLRVSEICFGTMTFGGKGATWKAIGALGEKEAAEMVARSLDAGVNFFDTAGTYGFGDAETFLGRALGPRRAGVVIATKVAFPTGKGPNERGLSRGHVHAALDASLRRLGTDYVDVFFAHTPDRLTPIEETLRAMDDLVRWGKVRHLGCSNFTAWQTVKANALAEALGGTRFEVAQLYYNLAARDIEREVVPCLQDQEVGLMVWSPLGSGVLTGKYSAEGKAPADARRAVFDLGPVDWDRVNRVLAAAKEIAEARGATVPQVALAWLLAKDVVTSVIVGAKRMPQLDENLGAAALALAPEEVARLDEASALAPEYPGWYQTQFAEV